MCCSHLQAQAGEFSDEEDMSVEQIDIRALERVSPRTSMMAPEQVQQTALPLHMHPLTAFGHVTAKETGVLDKDACPPHGM